VLIIVCFILSAVDYQFVGVGFSLYVLFAFFISTLRRDMRGTYGIQTGGVFSDFMAAFCLPMFTIAQLMSHVDAEGEAASPFIKGDDPISPRGLFASSPKNDAKPENGHEDGQNGNEVLC